MITDQRADEAFEYLRDSVMDIGKAKAELERSAILCKRVRRRIFLAAEGTVAQREAIAETNDDVVKADDRWTNAVENYEIIRAKREVEGIALDVWRTESANRRRA